MFGIDVANSHSHTFHNPVNSWFKKMSPTLHIFFLFWIYSITKKYVQYFFLQMSSCLDPCFSVLRILRRHISPCITGSMCTVCICGVGCWAPFTPVKFWSRWSTHCVKSSSAASSMIDCLFVVDVFAYCFFCSASLKRYFNPLWVYYTSQMGQCGAFL